jgi:archaemetzincin
LQLLVSGMSKSCQHKLLQLTPSAFAAEAGFHRPDAKRRLAATTNSGRLPASNSKNVEADARALSGTFPGPLVLPWDDLNHDPDWPAQSFRSWLNEEERNQPTAERETLYIAAVPKIDWNVRYMRDWIRPNIKDGEPPSKKLKGEDPLQELESPDVGPVIEYLSAFYHGLPVTQFPTALRFVPWKASKGKKFPTYVGLQYGDRMTRIRVRPSPDGTFKGQLNLNDILDAAIAMLPTDAYSIMLLVDHDIYEDEDDDYCCGRAYGGSRVAVVQSARYHPMLDLKDKIDHAHMWPASHCKDYVDKLCAEEDVKPPKSTPPTSSDSGAIRAAITTASQIAPPSSREELQALWFSRIARTVAHELGHCLGMDHCVYYACNLQGTAGMSEDGRQPPYLCPVCLTKVSYAIACELQNGDEESRQKYVRARYEALLHFCAQWKHVGLFSGYGAWIESRLYALEDKKK